MERKRVIDIPRCVYDKTMYEIKLYEITHASSLITLEVLLNLTLYRNIKTELT